MNLSKRMPKLQSRRSRS